MRQRKCQISNIGDWKQAFAVYMAALVSHHPSATLELLAYMVTIIKASQQYDGLHWRAYDSNYRLTAAATGNRTWSHLETDLFTRFFTGRAREVSACTVCDSLLHRTSECPEGSTAQRASGNRRHEGGRRQRTGVEARRFSQNWAPDICAEFNAKGCKHRHVCAECNNGQHPAKQCPGKQ